VSDSGPGPRRPQEEQRTEPLAERSPTPRKALEGFCCAGSAAPSRPSPTLPVPSTSPRVRATLSVPPPVGCSSLALATRQVDHQGRQWGAPEQRAGGSSPTAVTRGWRASRTPEGRPSPNRRAIPREPGPPRRHRCYCAARHTAWSQTYVLIRPGSRGVHSVAAVTTRSGAPIYPAKELGCCHGHTRVEPRGPTSRPEWGSRPDARTAPTPHMCPSLNTDSEWS
jgi:hypothetical protein